MNIAFIIRNTVNIMSKDINQRVAICRKLAGLTQSQTAEKLGMKSSTYSQMERKGNISPECLIELAKIFGADPDYLIYGKEKNQELDFSSPKNTVQLKQDSFSDKNNLYEGLILTKSEENIIKLFRHLSKEAKSDIIEYINKVYRDSKK